MSDIFDDWKKILDDFQNSVSKELSEIRKQKEEVQQIKLEVFNRLESCKFIRDKKRIVLSAPEIIIGNVNKDGMLSGDGGVVVIKGTNVKLDGVGEKGTIISRAASIQQTAVDPGVDGIEAVVYPDSSITSQARNIVLQSNDGKGCFSQEPVIGNSGVTIHSDTTMHIEAVASVKNHKQAIENLTTKLKSDKMQLEMDSQKQKLIIETDLAQFKAIIAPHDMLNSNEMLTRVNYQELQEIHNKVQELLPKIYQESVDFIHTISHLAETNRQIDALDKEKSALKSEDDFKKNTTNAGLYIAAEYMEVDSKDGDGNLHENPEAGIYMNVPHMTVAMKKEDGSLIDKSYLTIQAEQVDISTANPKESDQSTELPASGSVSIISKDIYLAAVDAEVKNKKSTEKALAKEGKITLRAEKVNLSATDAEGKATGSVDINAKAVAVKSMDVDKDKRTDKELTKGSSMLLLSEKMYVGAKDKDNKSKKLQAVSEEVGLFADKTLEAQQGDGKAVLQLADGNAAISGSKTQVFGETTLNGKTTMKDELKAPKATIDNVEAKTSFKSSNISDGIPVPPPPSTAKLSAKLKTEDAPKE